MANISLNCHGVGNYSLQWKGESAIELELSQLKEDFVLIRVPLLTCLAFSVTNSNNQTALTDPMCMPSTSSASLSSVNRKFMILTKCRWSKRCHG